MKLRTKEISIALNQFTANITLAALKSCIPTTSTTFFYSFFETVKIRQCLDKKTVPYKTFVVTSEYTVKNNILTVQDITLAGIQKAEACVSSVLNSTGHTVELIKNDVISSTNAVNYCYDSVMSSIVQLNATVLDVLKQKLQSIITRSNSMQNIINITGSYLPNELLKLSNPINDVVEFLRTYQPDVFQHVDISFNYNLFANVQQKVNPRLLSAFADVSDVINSSVLLLGDIGLYAVDSAVDEANSCLSSTSLSQVDKILCLKQVNQTYGVFLDMADRSSTDISVKFDNTASALNDTLNWINNKVQHIRNNANQTIEVLFLMSGLDFIEVATIKLSKLISTQYNNVISSIQDKLNQIVTIYQNLGSFKDNITTNLSSSVKGITKPISNAVQLLSVYAPSTDLYSLITTGESLTLEANSAIVSLVDSEFGVKADGYFTEAISLNQSYYASIADISVTGYYCVANNENLYSKEYSCLNDIISKNGKHFNETNEKLKSLIVSVSQLRVDAESSINARSKLIVQSYYEKASNSITQFFNEWNITVDSFFKSVVYEIGMLNYTLTTQLFSISDNILQEAGSYYSEETRVFADAEQKLVAACYNTNYAVSTIKTVYPTSELTNKTVVSLYNAAVTRINATFHGVTTTAVSITRFTDNVTKQITLEFAAVVEQKLRNLCVTSATALGNVITCLVDTLDRMTGQINNYTEVLDALSNDVKLIGVKDIGVLLENATYEIAAITTQSNDYAEQLYLQYGLSYDQLYSLYYKCIDKLLVAYSDSCRNAIQNIKNQANALPAREDTLHYNTKNQILTATACLQNAINAVKYYSNPNLIGNLSDVLTFVRDNATNYLNPLLPNYTQEYAKHMAVYNDSIASYWDVIQSVNTTNLAKTCVRTVHLYTFDQCMSDVSKNFTANFTTFYAKVKKSESVVVKYVQSVDAISANFTNNVMMPAMCMIENYTKPLAEDLYARSGFTKDRILQFGLNNNNSTYNNMYTQVYASYTKANSTLPSILSINFTQVYPICSNLLPIYNKVSPAIVTVLSTETGTVTTELSDARSWMLGYVKDYENYCQKMVNTSVSLGASCDKDLRAVVDIGATITMDNMTATCWFNTSRYPVCDSQLCSNTLAYLNYVDVQRKLNSINSVLNQLTNVANTSINSATTYGSNLVEQYRVKIEAMIKEMYQRAGLL